MFAREKKCYSDFIGCQLFCGCACDITHVLFWDFIHVIVLRMTEIFFDVVFVRQTPVDLKLSVLITANRFVELDSQTDVHEEDKQYSVFVVKVFDSGTPQHSVFDSVFQSLSYTN